MKKKGEDDEVPILQLKIWLTTSLTDSIANIGYPIGMGLGPNPVAMARAAEMICQHLLETGWQPPRPTKEKDDE